MTAMVVCPEPLAAAAGEAVLRAGGNAADAAVATAFTQGVTNPLACGVGGFGLFHVYDSGGNASTVHGSAVIGSARAPDSLLDNYVGRAETVGRHLVRDDANQFGHLSVLVPGFVAAAAAVFERFGSGRVSWSSVLQKAATLATDGFAVYPYMEKYYWFGGPDRPGYPDARRKLSGPAGAGAIYLKGDRYYRTGELLRQPDYGTTLERIAGEGGDDFYRGRIAASIADDFLVHGGLLTLADLHGYEVHTDAPVAGTYRGYTVLSSPPPSHGAQVLHMLNLLEPFDLAKTGWNTPDYIQLVSRLMSLAFADNAELMGEAPSSAMSSRLLSKQYSADQLRRAARGRLDETRRIGQRPPENTTHASVIDHDGLVVSVTHSIGSVAGAGFVTPGLGFLYNNLLGHFSPQPNRLDSIAPKKRMDGGAPTILLRDGTPVLAIGSSGGSRLISSIVQTIVNVVDHHMGIQQAVSVPRFHSERDGVVAVEADIMAQHGDDLRTRGLELNLTDYMGCNQAVMIESESGTYFAGTDPRGGEGVGVSFH